MKADKKDLEKYKQMILQRSQSQTLVLSVNGKSVEVPVRMPHNGEHCIIDTISFVVDIDDFYKWATYSNEFVGKSWLDTALDDELKDKHQAVEHLGEQIGQRLAMIFGDDVNDIFGQLAWTGGGLHGYKFAFNIGVGGKLGKVAFGGNKNGVYVSITGLGCAMAIDGWESRLYKFLSECNDNAHLTRIDIAHDDFNGDYSNIIWADNMESEGAFFISGQRPKVQQLGDWKHHTGDGRTLQIGVVQNGKCQINYEKGKQLGDKSSQWLRAECRISNQNKDIPLDILLNPTDYFCGFYPFNEMLIQRCIDFKQKQSNNTIGKDNGAGENLNSIRIPVIVKTAKVSLEKSIKIWQKQIGRYITAFREFFKDDKIILDLLQSRKKGEYPKRLAHFAKDDIKQIVPQNLKMRLKLHESAIQVYNRMPQSDKENIDFSAFLQKSDSFFASLVGFQIPDAYA